MRVRVICHGGLLRAFSFARPIRGYVQVLETYSQTCPDGWRLSLCNLMLKIRGIVHSWNIKQASSWVFTWRLTGCLFLRCLCCYFLLWCGLFFHQIFCRNLCCLCRQFRYSFCLYFCCCYANTRCSFCNNINWHIKEGLCMICYKYYHDMLQVLPLK